jgi:hypothetical protein
VNPKTLRGWWERPENVRALANCGKVDSFLVLEENQEPQTSERGRRHERLPSLALTALREQRY